MSSSAGKLFGDISIPKGFEGEIIASCLRSEGWESLSYSEMTDEITGKLERTEKKGDLSYSYDYRIKCRWTILEVQDKIRVFVQISDRENQSKKFDCEKLCFSLLESISESSERASGKIKAQGRSTKHGSSRWAEFEDLKQISYLVKSDDFKQNGVLLGPIEYNGDSWRLVVPEEQAYRHTMVCGPTGCGKTSSIFIPNIIERSDYSSILTEATAGDEPPDLYAKTSGYRLSKGHKVYYFNPDDLASVRINPIAHVSKVSEAIDIAALLMQNTQNNFQSSGEKFWQDAERHLLTSLVMHTAPAGGHMGDIRSYIRKGPEKLGAILNESPIQAAKEEYDAFLNIGTENVQKCVMIGLMQRLNNWLDPKILALTEKTDVDFAALKNELFSFYVAVPAGKETLKPVASLILNYLISMVENTHFKHKVNLFLDEFTNFGYIPGLPGKMGIIRHKEIPVMLGCQDFVQIRIEYGDDPTKALFNNIATRVIFRSNDLMTAKNVSESLGQETVVERRLDTSCNVQKEEFGRPLMRPSEVMTMDKEKSIILNPDTDPIMIKRFSWKDYAEYTGHKRHEHEKIEVDDRLKKDCQKEKKELKWQQEVDEKDIEGEVEELKKGKAEKKEKKKEAPKKVEKQKKKAKEDRDFDVPI